MTEHRIADAVVVAAGRSHRMAGQDKLAAEIAGRSVLRWAVEAFAAAPEVDRLIVVAAPHRVEGLRSTHWLGALGATVVAGGPRRQESVAAGVAAATAEVVLVHDAARPLVTPALIARVVDGVRAHGAAIPALPVVDALKRVDSGFITGTAERSGLQRAQTPQGARRTWLEEAARAHAAGPDEIPDEAELLARHGIRVAVVPGDSANIKITLPEDLELARRLAGSGAGGRVAMGWDSHPFGPEDGLRLGGILIDGAPRLHGHSDGDVVLHALCDGLLAAAGLGDLGRLFPSGDGVTRGIDSRVLLSEVMTRLGASRLAPSSLDITILGARPRLGAARLDAMADSIATLTGAHRGHVSVKAATANLMGDEGAGRVLSASCLVSLGST